MIKKNVIIFFIISLIILAECIIVLEIGAGNANRNDDDIKIYVIEFLKLNIPTLIALFLNLICEMKNIKQYNKLKKVLNLAFNLTSILYYLLYEYMIFAIWFIIQDAKTVF